MSEGASESSNRKLAIGKERKRKNGLKKSNKENTDTCRMLGVDPDPLKMTVRVRSGTAFGRAREEGRGR